ncbi:MAG: DUF4174 domain-containing protein [Alphaproteobacteria bacterium]|nr:MAG: DUF4174 domain-containing protein [Alphaproteobacteria bacterium]TAF40277.1 MAG: DUF4174 domain-containing protein [Alphaproteobacteria bacterium]TAF77411.1 MAG: DUF4174 domain-containing protein [Alphaproteobacteria bacterium]
MLRLILFLSIPCVLALMFFSEKSKDSPQSLMEQHLWQDEVMLVFHDEAHRDDYEMQMRSVRDDARYVVYDIAHMHSVARKGITLPHMPATYFYEAFDVNPQQFMVILLRKDGTEAMRSPKPIL